ncbi:S-layer homology domain-containing protein [Bacillus litorisediminis]|uniref:S-layer homology domain-containing protein n=1 Tax=Bacillus litorisediminis TaxID=2922713 RepID=UPI001FAC383F|nr:S-layer homology domain-containing protein [Bacillus litorisediminis]
MKKALAAIATFMLVLSLFSLPTKQAMAAEDDITGHRLETEMRHLIELGVLAGYGNNIYKPNQTITRAEFANYVYRALNLPAGEHKFPDVSPSSSLAAGINAAAAAGLVQGGSDGKFRPNDLITREQMAVMIDKALAYLQMEVEEAPLPFTDNDQIQSSTFALAIMHNVHLEIIRGFDDNTFKPKQNATRAEAAAFISRLIRKYEEQQGGTAPEVYKVGTINSDGTISYGSQSYSTYNAAAAAVSSPAAQVISLGEKIVKMPSGIAITQPNPDNQAIFYSQPVFTNANIMFGVELYRELEYIESNDQYVKVRVADSVGYVKHSAVKLVPAQQKTNRSYYQVDASGDLIHLEYSYSANAYHTGYAVGPAPDFLGTGKKYYSWNGHDFYAENGTKVGTAYNYFQYLPIRTATSYTAEELDRFIAQKYQELGVQNGLLTGKGAFLKQVEQQYRINAMFILALAGHESRYGTSAYAIERNNLFGIEAFDSDPNRAKYFDSVEDCIIALAQNYMNSRYVSPNVSYDNGAVAGNKTVGVNVRYASDPYWGLKVARHMYGIDKALGGKELGKYEIGMTNTNGLNIRTQPTTSSSIVFTYDKPGYPVVILESVTQPDGSVWYKIISDKLDTKEAYVYSIYVNKLNTVNQ